VKVANRRPPFAVSSLALKAIGPQCPAFAAHDRATRRSLDFVQV
jgi:hypothetical protein